MAILSAYAINGIMKSKYFSKKILVLIVIIVGAIIIFDSSANPYPVYTEPISKIYEEIKNDDSNFVILESPIGTRTATQYTSHPSFDYYQTVHEKPIIGGYESRATIDSLKQSESYFFNKFRLHDNGEDILKQDLGVHGTSILNYFNIKYVVIHKTEPISFVDQTTRRVSVEDTTNSNVLTRTPNLMSEILNEKRPYYEDGGVIAYKIPESDSKGSFLLLGKGWDMYDLNNKSRAMYPESIIKIINPTEEKTDYSLKIKLMGYKDSRNVEIYFNGKYLLRENIPSFATSLELNKLQLIPGENIVSIKSDGYDIWFDEYFNLEQKISLIGIELSGN